LWGIFDRILKNDLFDARNFFNLKNSHFDSRNRVPVVMPNNENPTKAHLHAVWISFIINYGATNKASKRLQDFLQMAKKPANMKLYDFKT
jgi:hypothetical protein